MVLNMTIVSDTDSVSVIASPNPSATRFGFIMKLIASSDKK